MAIVVSYDTFVAIALESSTQTPYKESGHNAVPAVADYGVTSITGAAFLPLSGAESLATALNFADLPLPERSMFPNKYQSFATRAEGGLSIMVPPGLLGGGTDPASGFSIRDWAYNRYDSGIGVDAASQTKSATVWVRVGDLMKRFVGVKVSQADFQLNKGQPLIINLNCAAFGEEIIATQAFTAPSWWTNAVYGGDYATLTVGDNSIASGTIVNGVAATNLDSVSFSINNKLDDDPHRIWSSAYPRRMYNRDREITGQLEADYFGTTEYTRFLTGVESSIQLAVSRKISASTYTSTILFPRIRYDGVAGVNATGQKDQIIKQNINWKCLGGLVGVGGVSDASEMRWA